MGGDVPHCMNDSMDNTKLTLPQLSPHRQTELPDRSEPAPAPS